MNPSVPFAARQICVANLAEDLRLVRSEIARRDLSDIPTVRLLILAAHLRAKANRFNGPLRLQKSTAALPSNEDAVADPVVDWEVYPMKSAMIANFQTLPGKVSTAQW